MPDPTRLIDAYFDGVITDAEMHELDHMIATDPGVASAWVARSVMHRQIIDRIAVDKNTDVTTPAVAPTAPVARPPFGFSLAVAIAAMVVVGGAAVAIYAVFLAPDPAPSGASPVPIATLIESTGQVYVSDEPAFDGAEYPAGRIALADGEAEFVIAGSVGVRLRGQTDLVVHDRMRATLTVGEATFDCPPQAKGYTVFLPDGSRVVDLGTRFTVRVTESGRALVRTLEGVVEVEAVSGQTSLRSEGQVAMLDESGRVHAFTTESYDFSSLDASDFPGEPLAGQDGWVEASGNHPITIRGDGWLEGTQWAFVSSLEHYRWMHRLNDDRFGFAVADGSLLILEFDLRLGSTGRGGRLGFIDSDGRTLFAVGNNTPKDAPSAWTIEDASGRQTLGTESMPESTDAWYHVVATIDLAARDGGGSLSLAVAPVGHLPVDVPGMQDVDLNLGGIDGSDVSGLSLGLFNAGGLGRVQIHHVPAGPETTNEIEKPQTQDLKGTEE